MAKNVCVNPTPSYKKYGFSQSFMDGLRKQFGSQPNPRNIAKNLGLDAEDAVNLQREGGKGRVLGRNLTTIDEFNAKVASTKGVPKDTIVRVPDIDGGSPNHFISANNNNKTMPSRWVFDGGNIRSNPDWDSLGVNQTIDNNGQLRSFVRDDNGTYRLPKGNERGEYFLNVQKAVDTDEPLTNSYIVQHGIDAYEVAPNTYRLVDENSQAIKIKHADTQSNKGAVSVETTETPLSEANVRESLIKSGLTQKVAGAVAGGIVGHAVDQDDEFGGTFWGGAVGFMAGSPRIRSRVHGVFSRSGRKSNDPIKDLGREASVFEDKVKRQRELSLEGLPQKVDPDSKVAQEFQENYVVQVRQARNDGNLSDEGFLARLRELVFDNEWMKSGHYTLTSMGSNTSEWLLGVLKGFEKADSQLYVRFSNKIQDALGTRDTKQAFEEIQTSFMRRVYGDEVLNDEQALDGFGSAVMRLIRNQARIDQGQLRHADDIAARSDYALPEVRNLDRQILNDPEARKIFEITREYYEEAGRQHVMDYRRQIQTAIEQSAEAGGIQGKYKQLARAIQETNKHTNDFKETYKNDSALFTEAMNQDSAFKRMVEQHNKAHEIEQLQGRYVPQKWDNAKAQRVKDRWLRNEEDNIDEFFSSNGQQFTNRDEAIEHLWQRKVAGDILATNREKFSLFSFDKANDRAGRKLFDSRGNAEREVERIISERLPEAEYNIIAGNVKNISSFVKPETIGKKEMYFIEVPEQFREFGGGNIFRDDNIEAITQAHRNQNFDQTITRSNHLDRARNYQIPTQYLTTDIDRLVRGYSRDVGPRIHALNNGIYDNAQLEAVLRKIRNEVMDKNPNASKRVTDKVEKNLDQIRTWWKTMQGFKSDMESVAGNTEGARRKLTQESLKRARNDTFFNTLGRFATAPFQYATSFYAPLQMAVLGPFLFGWKNTLNAYKVAITDPQRLKAMSQELRKMNHIYDGILAYSPERRAEFRNVLLGENYSPALENFARLTDGMENFAVNLSLTKPLLGKMGIRMDDTGIFRLFGGSLLDVSGAEASLASLGAMRHVEDLVEAGSRLLKDPDMGQAQIGRRNLSMNQIRRELEEFGVSDADRFLREKDEFNKFADQVGGGKAKPSDWMYGQMTHVLGEAVNAYHGKSKMVRPLKWLNNSFGRLFSQFSTYTQNFGIQTTRNRIYLPIRDWDGRYGSQISDDTSMFRFAFEAGRGNTQFFQQRFGDGWQEAYREFPTQAYSNFFKVFGALGVGKALLIGRSGVMDILEIITNEALGNDDYEAWRGVNRQLGLGFEDPVTGREATFGDLFAGDLTGYEMFRAIRAAFEDAIQLGFAGPYSGKVLDELRYGRGAMNAFPVGSSIGGLFDIMKNMYQAPSLGDIPKQTAEDIFSFGLLHTPPIGTAHGMRRGIENKVFQEPVNQRQMRDAETGESGEYSFVSW